MNRKKKRNMFVAILILMTILLAWLIYTIMEKDNQGLRGNPETRTVAYFENSGIMLENNRWGEGKRI